VFETINKAKQLGVLGLKRIGDYLELLRIEVEIQVRNVSERLFSFAVMILFILLALLFLGLAVIITYWDTKHRIMVAWSVFAFCALAAGASYLLGRRRQPIDSALQIMREELQKDIQLLKDLLGVH